MMRQFVVGSFFVGGLLAVVGLVGCQGSRQADVPAGTQATQEASEVDTPVQAGQPQVDEPKANEPQEAAAETPPVSKEAIKDAFSLKNKAGLAAPVEESKVGK